MGAPALGTAAVFEWLSWAPNPATGSAPQGISFQIVYHLYHQLLYIIYQWAYML